MYLIHTNPPKLMNICKLNLLSLLSPVHGLLHHNNIILWADIGTQPKTTNPEHIHECTLAVHWVQEC